MSCQDEENDTVWRQPVLAKREKLLIPTTTPPSSPPVASLSRQLSPFFPDELIVEILLRVPVRSLLQFRCVSKSWKTLISDSQFAKDHLRTSTADPNMAHHRLVSSTIVDHCKIVSCSVQSLFQNPSNSTKAVSFRMKHKYHILGSCNGLLCLYDIYQGYIRLWNPSTRLRSKRSPIVVSIDGLITYHGFGYDHVNDKYKVLVVVDDFNETVTKVYTFGANSWTTIQDFPCHPTRGLGKFVSGTINWVARGGVNAITDQWVILSLDLGKESYGEMLLPDRDGDSNLYSPVLDVLRNCLCACFDCNKTHWVVWQMKEYGVEQSWTKLTMIPYVELQVSRWIPSLDPLCISENGIVLLKTTFSKLVLFNSTDGSLDYPRIRSKIGLDVHIYHESLVSP